MKKKIFYVMFADELDRLVADRLGHAYDSDRELRGQEIVTCVVRAPSRLGRDDHQEVSAFRSVGLDARGYPAGVQIVLDALRTIGAIKSGAYLIENR